MLTPVVLIIKLLNACLVRSSPLDYGAFLLSDIYPRQRVSIQVYLIHWQKLGRLRHSPKLKFRNKESPSLHKVDNG